jgi:hypothetical protein
MPGLISVLQGRLETHPYQAYSRDAFKQLERKAASFWVG